MTIPLNLLLVEDSEDDALLLIHELRRGGFDPKVDRVTTKAAFRKALKQGGWEAVVSDFNLPRFTGRDAFQVFQDSGLDLPFILLSGVIDIATAAELMAAGVHDFIEKGDLSRLVPALLRELRAARMRQDHRNAQQALLEREAVLTAIFDNSTTLIDLKDAEGHYLLVNKEYERRRNVTSRELKGTTPADHMPPETAEAILVRHREIVKTGEAINCEIDVPFSDGDVHHLFVTKFPIRDEGGNVAQVGSISTDITERKQAELDLWKNEQLFRAVINNSPTAISLKGTDGRFILVNNQWMRQHKLARDEAIGKTLYDILPPEEAAKLDNHDHKVMETGIPAEFEIELTAPDGLPQTDRVVKFPIVDPDGIVMGVGSACTNITERKRAEEALRWSERDLRGILDNMVDTFFRTDRNGRVIMISPSVKDLLGLSPEKTLGKDLTRFFADPAAVPQLMEILEQQAGELTGYEVRLRRVDGNEIWVLTTARHYFDEDGDIAGIEGVAHDITARKRAEEALEKSEDRFRDFAEASSDWMWESGPDQKFTYISERIADVAGIKPENVIGKTRQEFSTNTDWKALDQTLERKKPFRDFEYSLLNDTGETRIVRISGKPRFDENREFLGYRGTGTDITEQRATEQREARTRQRFLDAIETVPVGFALYDGEDRLVLWNNLYETLAVPEVPLKVGMLFGAILRESIAKETFENVKGREEEWFEQRLSHHRNPTSPLVLLRQSTWVQVREHKTPDGSTLLVVVDITDLRRAEDSLRESERQLKAILDNIPEIAWLKDRGNHFIAVNEAFARVCGRNAKDLVGKSDFDVWPHELAEDYRADDEEVKRTKIRKRVEELVEQSDGRRFWVETIRTPIFNEKGDVVGTVGTGRDITERKNTEQTLRKLSAAVEQSPASTLITNLKGSVEYANPKFFETTGYDVWEVLGKTPFFLKSDYSDPEQFDRMWTAIKSGKEWRGELQNRKKNGEIYWSSIAVSPITNTQGDITNILSIAEDTTEKRRMDEQLRHAQKLEAVGTLAGGVAHDFNNILTGILGHSHIAVEKLSPDDPVQFNLAQIKVASDRAKDLVQQLLAFSRRREADLRAVNLHSIVDEATKLIHASIPSIIKIHWNVADNAGTVMADPTQIHQVLLNLCGNAADAIGNSPGTIDISVENVVTDAPIAVSGTDLMPGRYARLRVSDTGSGMDAYTQSRVFDPFFTTKPVGSGTGLGLAAVHGIVQDHGGGIELVSEPGKGSSFNIYLPCVGEEEIQDTKEVREKFSGTERILLVDDERMVLQSIGPYLEHFGYKVEALTSAKAALAVFQSMPDQFDILVTDQMMPGMTGDILAKKVREIRPDLPIILCTGYAPPTSKNAQSVMEMNEIVSKPVEPSELGHVIRKALDGGSDRR